MTSNTDLASRRPRPCDRHRSLLKSETKFGVMRFWLPKWLTRLLGFCSMTPTLGNLSQPRTAAGRLSQPARPARPRATRLSCRGPSAQCCFSGSNAMSGRIPPLLRATSRGQDPLGFAPAQVQIRHRSKVLEAFGNTVRIYELQIHIPEGPGKVNDPCLHR